MTPYHNHCQTLRSQLEQVYAKGTNIGAPQATSWVEEVQSFSCAGIAFLNSLII